jgi:colanic acid biosynthesis glycosyl transferase WcaI
MSTAPTDIDNARSRPLRVCFFNRSYWPDTGATGQLLTELAEDLVARYGYQVTVVTGYPVNGPGGKLRRRDTRGGVHIVRAAGTRFRPRLFAARATNYVSYFASALLHALALPRQDVVVAMTDPPIIGVAALAVRGGARFVFCCQDIFPEVGALLEDFRSRLVDRLLERINRHLIRRADRIVALGDKMARILVDKKGADAARVVVIDNWADTDAIEPSDKTNPFSIAHGLHDSFVALHAGNIGLGQNLDIILDAAALTRDCRRLVWLFIGDGTRKAALQASAAARGLENVRFLPPQPREHLRWTYATADVCLVSLKPGLGGYIVPSKIYPILAAGRPYVAAVDADSETAALTERYGCGLLAGAGDGAAIATQVRRLAADAALRATLGAKARGAAEQFSRTRQVAAHAALLAAVADGQC